MDWRNYSFKLNLVNRIGWETFLISETVQKEIYLNKILKPTVYAEMEKCDFRLKSAKKLQTKNNFCLIGMSVHSVSSHLTNGINFKFLLYESYFSNRLIKVLYNLQIVKTALFCFYWRLINSLNCRNYFTCMRLMFIICRFITTNIVSLCYFFA